MNIFVQSNFIDLSNCELIAKGGLRLVYRHPEEASWLVKVIDPVSKEIRYGEDIAFYKFPRRYAHYMSYFREISEYIAVWSKEGCSPYFLQKVIGFAETELGLALIVEAAFDEHGNYAPTLAKLYKQGSIDDGVLEKLHQFFEHVEKSDVIVSDMHAGNIAYAFTPDIGFYFVLIDGIGCSTLIPVKAIFRSLNRRSKKRKIRALLETLQVSPKSVGT